MSKTATKEKVADKQDTEGQEKEPRINPFITQASEFVKDKFSEELAPKFLFHNYAYSEEIAEKVEELGKAAGAKLSDQEAELREILDHLVIAAYFYPTGYIGGAHQVGQRSADLLREWAKEVNFSLTNRWGDTAEWVETAHDAREEDQLPVRLLHDAAHSWLGRKRYDRRSDLLQLERDALASEEGDPVKFGQEMQDYLLNFNFLTTYAKEEYDKRRRKNVAKQQSSNYKTRQKEVKAKTGKNFGRGIDTVYRTAFRTHINLSTIADGKANMMISINTIILSLVLAISGTSFGYFEDVFFENPEFLIPIITLLLTSLIAVIFAVFSARPSVTEYTIKKDKLIKSKKASLLYFGNFLKLEKTDFVSYLSNIKLDQGALYDDLSRDLYDLGAVLHKKYLLLTISYNTFVGGLFLAVISYLIVFLLNVYAS